MVASVRIALAYLSIAIISVRTAVFSILLCPHTGGSVNHFHWRRLAFLFPNDKETSRCEKRPEEELRWNAAGSSNVSGFSRQVHSAFVRRLVTTKSLNQEADVGGGDTNDDDDEEALLASGGVAEQKN